MQESTARTIRLPFFPALSQLSFTARLAIDSGLQRFVASLSPPIMVYVVFPQDSLKEEEKLKKELRLRMAYAGFLQETVTAMAVKKKTRYVVISRQLLAVRQSYCYY